MRKIVSGYAFRIIKRILPKISATEKAALNSGSVSIDGDIFSGYVDVNKLVSKYDAKLKDEEKEFLSNQTDKLCEMIDNDKIEKNQDLTLDTWDYIKKNKFMGLVIQKKYDGLEIVDYSTVSHRNRYKVLEIIKNAISKINVEVINENYFIINKSIYSKQS